MLPIGFWEKVRRQRDDQCWPWLASTTRNGYGQVRADGRNQKAHRLSYTEARGEIPLGMVVMHTCDNRRCVNPNHLRLGTPRENNKDRDIKGRQVSKRGEAHGMSKLRENQAAEIVALRSEINRRVSDFAVRFGVSKTTVRDLLAGRSWKWLA